MKLFYNKYRNLRSKITVLLNRLIYGSNFVGGEGLYVRKGFVMTIEEEGCIQVGKNVFFNNYCSLNALKKIMIGNNCIFGENVHVYDHNHKYGDKNIPVNDQGFTKAEVTIEDNCWIASNVIILKGVTIGAGSVIGANCIIYKDVPANSIVKLDENLIVEKIRGRD